MIDEKIDFISNVIKEARKKVNKPENMWWPRYVYHYSNIDNICSILDSKRIYSREQADSLGIMRNENANESVLSNTNDEIKNMARFYFRPLTKTQLSNEGFKAELSGRVKHVPTPVFLFVNILSVFLIPNIKFTDKHPLVSDSHVYSNISDLNKLDFGSIYHDGGYQSSDYVRNCRQAEIWVPNFLPTSHIMQICVRSMADKEFLLYSLCERGNLEQREIQEIEDKILVKKTLDVFFNKGTHIDNIYFSNQELIITLHNPSACKEVKMTVLIHDGINVFSLEWNLSNTRIYTSDFVYEFTKNDGSFLVEVYFDKILMYKNKLVPKEESLVF